MTPPVPVDVRDMLFKIPILAGQIPNAAERVAHFAIRNGCGEESGFQIQVMVAEVLNNIVSHGLAPDAAGSISIYCAIADSCLEVTILDDGRPLRRLPDDPFPSAQAENGRGWPIIREWSDKIDYRSSPGRNVLTLSRRVR